MVVNRKKDCKIILDNLHYYVETSNHFFKFNSYDEAKYFYDNYNKLIINELQGFDNLGRLCLKLYPEDIELILKGIEQLKFFIDKSFYFTDDKEKLKNKSQDCFYLFEYIHSVYIKNNLK